MTMHDDEIFDLFEEMSTERENQRDKSHWETVTAQPIKKPKAIDTGEECIGG